MAKRSYTADDITSITNDRDKVRTRPTIYIPSKDEAGSVHIIFEVVDNAIDELTVKDSVGDNVTLSFDATTKVVTVIDNGAGIPLEKLLEVCTVLNSSGKWSNTNNTSYQWSGGLNGCGLKTAVFLSEWCEVTSMRNGKKLTYRFEDGIMKDTAEQKCKDHGVIVKFKIDNKLVKINTLDPEILRERCEEKSYRFPGIVINFTLSKDGKVKKKYTYTGKTIVDRVQMMNPDTDVIYGNAYDEVEVLKNADDDNLTKEEVKVEFALAFKEEALDEEDVNKNIITYGNTIKTYTGGAHLEGFRNGVVRFFRNEVQPNLNKRERELPITPSDIYSGLVGFVIAQVHSPEFKGQYKDELMNPEARRAVQDCVYKTLQNAKPAFIKKMSEFIVRVTRGRLESKKTRTRGKDVNNTLSKDHVKKYVPIMKTADTFESELILVEGQTI